ncbi:MAG: VanZ family protein [Pseudomonadota bacterium]
MSKEIDGTAPQASPVARVALLAYLLLIVYASLYPFSGWHNSGLSPFAYLNTTPPQYWTLFDAAINVIGYVPFGILLMFSLYPRVRGLWALLLAALAALLVSGAMEAVQTFLPSRVASNLDFLTNAAGAVLGACIGKMATRALLEQSRLHQLRQRWFAPQASAGLVLLGLWPLAQIYPQAYLFGNGQLLPIVSEWLSSWLDMNIDLVAMLRPDTVMTVEQYWLSETIITACGMTGAVLTMLCVLRRGAPRTLLALALVAATLLVKALASALLFTPANAFVWMTPGAEGGFLIGAIMLSGLAFAPQQAQRRIAVLTLLLSLLVLNDIPVNPYFSSTLQSWVQGKFLNFNGAAQFLALLWPFFALCYLFLPAHKHHRS